MSEEFRENTEIIRDREKILILFIMAKRWASLSLFLSIFLAAMVVSHSADGPPPAIFILGDSTADVGTNTLLPQSFVRADFPFHGIDFPHSRPTGRFSNAFNTADFLGQYAYYQTMFIYQVVPLP